MPKTLEFWFDVGSPAAYLAWTQMPRLSAETGATVDYRPMLLGGVFQATGNRSPMEVPAKSRYMKDDLARFAHRYGVEYRQNPHFPINTLTLMRGALGVQLRQPQRLRAYGDAVLQAIWVEGRNLNDAAEVGAVLAGAGFEPRELLALTQEPEVKERLKAVTQEAVGRGVFGAPTFFVGDQMFWGQDRLDHVKEALQ
ncbi:MAG TPA: 2-hydroxychromene-2-carboxylate isomerase [Ramlibacter sp.]|jgi:2-hydroxychromene-2-carboxylate isomerase|uniref:2-hydroxychromene-2-carboxylate isomerase n=1 Tax=Ramlibacter sp. TaxID=1917967 RepID=UPI002D36893F|nr:2-hydroxychromene-2-carboxylate isomerase [Ramlibacter sp.]HZY17496.1 2-hydroxychromene-2-carboxylate isomerase [Ramlibacter sp.]